MFSRKPALMTTIPGNGKTSRLFQGIRQGFIKVVSNQRKWEHDPPRKARRSAHPRDDYEKSSKEQRSQSLSGIHG